MTTNSGTGGSGATAGPGGQGGVGGGCVPSEELCNGVDDNCDNQVDEGCACIEGDEQACYTGDPLVEGIGACLPGVQTCDLNGNWGVCEDEGAPSAEVCNGIDDDCDEETDEELGSVTCGLGICQITVAACENGEPVACIPGAPNPMGETCDGSDDDCDGQVDEGCSCINGQTQPCYTSDPNEIGVGLCVQGSQLCAGGQWGACTGAITPAAETCDGLDNDCDGATDNGDPGGGASCNTMLQGVCAAGTIHCTQGSLQCEQNVQPSMEVCNALDDDCNGIADNGNPGGGAMCGTGLLGVCAAGTEVCVAGAIICQQTTQSSPEQCNALDDDCDGVADDGNPGGGNNCNTGLMGICAAGTQTCTGGMISCQQNNQAGAETCNNLDDDCDGVIDDGNPGGGGACNTGQPGICAAGMQTCVGGAVVCQQSMQASSEICNGLDDDCDGVADDGDPGGGSACNTGLSGICAAGTQHCSGGALSCQQNNQAGTETCNNLDDDCNGVVDNGNPGGGGNCSTGLPGVCSAGTLNCSGGALSCQQNTQASAETCNGLDDDCDGLADNGNPGGGGACNTGNPGICAAGTQICSGGALVCQQTNQPAVETCNGVDDDCDGIADDGNPGGGGGCNTGLPGICSTGTLACSAGALSCQQNNPPATETCNGLDDDCDGVADDGNPGGGGACNTGLFGICAAGTQACVSGAIACQQSTSASPEVCNGLDDDCDGVADDGNPGGGSSCNTGLLGICAAGTVNCSAGALSCEQNNQAQASENCGNNLDDDCNGAVDDGCTCAPGSYNCDGVGACECTVGNGCCGGSCQTSHANGEGQNFYDCVALGTFNATQALKACAAFTGNPAVCSDLGAVCSGGATSVVCGDNFNATGDCACWGYGGTAAGYVYNEPSDNSCLCPLVGDPQWN